MFNIIDRYGKEYLAHLRGKLGKMVSGMREGTFVRFTKRDFQKVKDDKREIVDIIDVYSESNISDILQKYPQFQMLNVIPPHLVDNSIEDNEKDNQEEKSMMEEINDDIDIDNI